jgi:hypothetical protein
MSTQPTVNERDVEPRRRGTCGPAAGFRRSPLARGVPAHPGRRRVRCSANALRVSFVSRGDAARPTRPRSEPLPRRPRLPRGALRARGDVGVRPAGRPAGAGGGRARAERLRSRRGFVSGGARRATLEPRAPGPGASAARDRPLRRGRERGAPGLRGGLRSERRRAPRGRHARGRGPPAARPHRRGDRAPSLGLERAPPRTARGSSSGEPSCDAGARPRRARC